MKLRNHLSLITSFSLLLLLVVDSKSASLGAYIGIDLCIRTVIPSLLPFFILCMFITASIDNYDTWLISRLSSLMHIPPSAASVVIPAFLGGYPVGAKCVADLYRSRVLTRHEAERMLAFCSNAGPSFLFGMISACFPDKKMIWELWAFHIAGALVAARVFPSPASVQDDDSRVSNPLTGRTTDIMRSSLIAMAVVCGWIILFRIVITFLESWILGMIPDWLRVLVTGCLELANGCCALMEIQNLHLRFILCGIMLSLGGVCVFLQTSSVAGDLSLRYYVAGKLIQALVSTVLCCIVLSGHFLLFSVVVMLLLIFLVNAKNKSGNPKRYPV